MESAVLVNFSKFIVTQYLPLIICWCINKEYMITYALVQTEIAIPINSLDKSNFKIQYGIFRNKSETYLSKAIKG